MTMVEEIISWEKENLKINEYAFFKADRVSFSEEVRGVCARNSCGGYRKTWACPPAVGTLEECKEMCSAYENAFIFNTVAHLEDMYDIEEWDEAYEAHEAATEKVAKIFRGEYEKPLVLSVGGCRHCEKCTYPDNPCRFPDRMFPGAEGFGIIVNDLAKECNIKYMNGANTITYFSVVFF